MLKAKGKILHCVQNDRAKASTRLRQLPTPKRVGVSGKQGNCGKRMLTAKGKILRQQRALAQNDRRGGAQRADEAKSMLAPKFLIPPKTKNLCHCACILPQNPDFHHQKAPFKIQKSPLLHWTKAISPHFSSSFSQVLHKKSPKKSIFIQKITIF